MIPRIRGPRPLPPRAAAAAFLAVAVALANVSPGGAFRPLLLFPPPPRLAPTRQAGGAPGPSILYEPSRRISLLAAQAAATPAAPLAGEARDARRQSDISNDNYSDLHLLRRHRTSKDVETAVVRLGRRGKTDDALRLYRAVWTLDGLRQRTKQQQSQKSGTAADANTAGETGEPTQELIQFASNSKVRPTTRLMNSAIDACARSHPPARQEEAFAIFHWATSPVNADGTKKPGGALSPNVFTFGSLLACCARNGDVAKSLELLKVLEKGEEYPDVVPNGVVYSTVISACERAPEPRVDVALEVLNRGMRALSSNGNNGPKNNMGGGMGVVGYNAAISTLARAAEWRRAVQLLGEMILHSSPPKTSEESSSEQLSRSNPQFEPLESLREDTTATPLLTALSENAAIVVPIPDEVTFGTVLAACERSKKWEALLHVADAAAEYGVRLDGLALTSALHACQQLGLADEALAYLERMKCLANEDENEGANAKGRRRRRGNKRPLRGPDGVAYRLAISACARSPGGHRWRDGLHLLDEMRLAAQKTNRTDGAPDVMAYTAAIAGCSEAGEYTEALRLIATMRGEGVQPNVVTFSAAIGACASASARAAASQRRDEEADGGGDEAEDDDVTAPMKRALRLLAAMKAPGSAVRPNVVTYNAAIRACAEGLHLQGALDLLTQLETDGLEPTIVTYGSLMTACERVGDVEAASRVFRMVKAQGLTANEIIYGAAISCCRRARQPDRALLLLRKMISEELAPNTATFNTVIAALAEGGRRQAERSQTSSADSNEGPLWEKALAVYRAMKSTRAPPGVQPNRQTYNILVRCLASGLHPGHAEAVLHDMREAGFVPDVDLYTMTVRSYERCGSPMKALGLMESMREGGEYDFYGIKVFDEAFKSGVRILNKVGRGLSSGTGGGAGVSYAMGEEVIDFGDDDQDDDDEDGF
ncbi:hypothetical protein ACHAXT_005710 [Thalassiosira profunda]